MQLNIAKTKDNSLLGGRVGICLYLLSHQDIDKTEIVEILSEIICSLDGDITPSFGLGIAGICQLCLIAIDNNVIDREEIEETLAILNSYLFKQFKILTYEGHTDYLFGSSGILNYFITNKEITSSEINICLDELLGSKNIDINFGFEANRHFPHINFGLAHGITGTGLVLLKVVLDNRVVNKKRIETVLFQLEAYIISFLDEQCELSLFPIKVFKKSGEILHSDALSWTYGDLGTVLFLLEVSKYQNDIIKFSNYCRLLDVILVKMEKCNVVETAKLGIRHGLAGRVLLLERLNEILPDNKHLKKVKEMQTDLFISLSKNMEIEEYIFERDLSAKTVMNRLTVGNKSFKIASLFLL